MLTAIPLPACRRADIFHSFAGCHSGKGSDVKGTENLLIFRTCLLEKRGAVGREMIVGIRPQFAAGGVATCRGHIDREVVTAGLFYQVVVIEKPADSAVIRIPVHLRVISLRFNIQLFQFLEIRFSKSIFPIYNQGFQQFPVTDDFLVGLVKHRVLPRTRHFISFIIIEAASSEIVDQHCRQFAAHTAPRGISQNLEHIKHLESILNGLFSRSCLSAIGMAEPVGSKPFHNPPAVFFGYRVHHFHRTMHNGDLPQRTAGKNEICAGTALRTRVRPCPGSQFFQHPAS